MNQERPPQSVKVSVPGKIMLAGEYSILKGGRCLAATVGARLGVTIKPALSFSVQSNLWPEPLDLWTAPRGEPLIDSLRFCASRYEIREASVQVESDLPVSYGLGSSSAVRLAAHVGLLAYANQDIVPTSPRLWGAARDAWLLQRAQQGFASGYDLVTQLHGGFVMWFADYENWPGPVRSLDTKWLQEWVHPYGGGQGAPTGTVGGGVRNWLDENQSWAELQLRSDQLIEAFLSESPDRFLPAIETHQQLLKLAPFYPHELYKSLASLSGFGRSWSFKTTGAGGEDTILLIGQRSKLIEADHVLRQKEWKRFEGSWSTQGLTVGWEAVDL